MPKVSVSQTSITYKRSRFSTRLPANYLYTTSHFWLVEVEPTIWQVGLTKFAARMLGDIVEYGFEIKKDQTVEVGQIIGWLEGFKAITDLYCVAAGEFYSVNSFLEEDSEIIKSDPYGKGWLYQVKGKPEPNALNVNGYAQFLDGTIDKMLSQESK